MTAQATLYKTLISGRSHHGGDMEWSLPKDGQPGEWAEVEGKLALCERGLHLTDDPATWWQPGCTVYLAEGEGVVGSCDDSNGRKVVCRRVRLLREATQDELTALRIYTEGVHETTSGRVVASGSASVEAYDSASVVASGSASVEAYGSASVVAYDSASVVGHHDVTIVSWYGQPGIKIFDRAVHIDRRDQETAPIVTVATKDGHDA